MKMLDWLKNEYRLFKKSRTIRLAYSQKAFALVTLVMSLLPGFRGYLTPELFILLNTVFGVSSNYLRKVTTGNL